MISPGLGKVWWGIGTPTCRCLFWLFVVREAILLENWEFSSSFMNHYRSTQKLYSKYILVWTNHDHTKRSIYQSRSLFFLWKPVLNHNFYQGLTQVCWLLFFCVKNPLINYDTLRWRSAWQWKMDYLKIHAEVLFEWDFHDSVGLPDDTSCQSQKDSNTWDDLRIQWVWGKSCDQHWTRVLHEILTKRPTHSVVGSLGNSLMFAVVVPKSEMFSGEMTYLTYTNSSGVFFRSQHLIQVWRPRMFFFSTGLRLHWKDRGSKPWRLDALRSYDERWMVHDDTVTPFWSFCFMKTSSPVEVVIPSGNLT